MADTAERATGIAAAAHALADLKEEDREIAVALSREIADRAKNPDDDDDDVPF